MALPSRPGGPLQRPDVPMGAPSPAAVEETEPAEIAPLGSAPTPVVPPRPVVATSSEGGDASDVMPVVIQRSAKSSNSDFTEDWMDDGIPFNIDEMKSKNPELDEGEGGGAGSVLLPPEAKKNDGDRYVSYGELTAQQAIEWDYDTKFAHLADRVEAMTSTVREILNDQGHAESIAAARRDRSGKYAEMATEVDRLVLRQLNDQRNSINVDPSDTKVFLAMVVNELLGFGPIEPLWQDKGISEIMINGPKDIRIELKGKTIQTNGIQFRDKEHLLAVTRQMLALMGRRVDSTHPMEDGSLPDGSRINAVHNELAPDGPLLTIRRFPDTVYSIRKMVSLNSMSEEMAVEIGNLIYMGCSTVIAGGTGTGKALSLSTRIPTTAGVKSLGDIQVGDQVFDENGRPTTVTGYFPQEPNRECFEVVFSDGSSVIADADHNWSFFQNGEWVVRTTTEARKVLLEESKAHKPTSLTVPVLSAPVVWDRKEAAVDAYQVGYDSGTDNALVVPQAVIYGSVEARKAFLEGFLDAGLESGRATAHSTGLMDVRISNQKTLEDVNFIINSLGDTQAFIESYENIESSLYFYLPEGVQNSVERRDDDEYRVEKNTRTIVDICPVDSVPVACISVDSPNHLYLFGDSFIPTHNTSMLNALSGCIPNEDRVITIEDTPELRLNPRKHIVRMVSRPGAGDGKGQVRIRDLVRNALRMRPDRVVVGEVRDSSAYDMMQAMNTGHEGSLTTVHANDAHGTVERISLLVSEAGEVTADRAISLVAGGVDIFIIINRYEDGSRRVHSVHEVPSRLTTTPEGQNVLITSPLFEFVHDSTEPDGRVVGHYEKRNDLSESLIMKHRLDKKRKLTLDELYELSDVSLEMPK